MNKYRLIIALLAVLIFNACSKSDPIPEQAGDVEIYLLKSFNESAESDVIDVATIVLESEPLLRYDDLEWYNSRTHTFQIADSKKELFKIDGNTIHFRAFAVKANNEVVYTGFFWPSYSSQIISWVVIDPLLAEMQGELKVSLGYPGILNSSSIPDLRNDSRIVNIFKRDNKLID